MAVCDDAETARFKVKLVYINSTNRSIYQPNDPKRCVVVCLQLFSGKQKVRKSARTNKMCVACIGVRRCEFQMAPDIVLWKPSTIDAVTTSSSRLLPSTVVQ